MNRQVFLRITGSAALSLLGGSLVLNGCGSGKFILPEVQGKTIIVKKSEFSESIQFVLVPTQFYPEPIYLRKFNENEFVALLLRCTHLGCQLDAGEDILSCPCHGSEFNPRGAVVNLPAERPLVQLPVKIQNETIQIQV